MAMAAEIMRGYDDWEKADFERFKHMMETYFYPVCHDFLTHQTGPVWIITGPTGMPTTSWL
jgi:hypothetical protein